MPLLKERVATSSIDGPGDSKVHITNPLRGQLQLDKHDQLADLMGIQRELPVPFRPTLENRNSNGLNHEFKDQPKNWFSDLFYKPPTTSFVMSQKIPASFTDSSSKKVSSLVPYQPPTIHFKYASPLTAQ